nr:hypothetical protein [uncultured Psychroserpens sp.]
MKTTIYLVLISVLSLQISYAQPKYASNDTKDVIEKMIKSHGGIEQWNNVKTQSFTSAMHSESLGFLRFWIKTQTTDMSTRRSYQDWPLVGSKLSYDGKEVWTSDWRVGNPPNHQHSVFFYYVNLPWLTQDKDVLLGEVSKLQHKAFKNEVYKIKMTFAKPPVLGKSKNDSYTLFIDSETYLLSGYEYTVGYGPLLDQLKVPKDKAFFGPVLRVNTYTGDVNGLKFPMLMTTHSLDMSEQYGDHAIYSYELNGTFDESRMAKTENAIVDTSKDVRK